MDTWFIRAVGAIVVLIVGTIGAVSLERLGDIQTELGQMSASVDRIAEIDEIKERLLVLEGGNVVIPHAQLSSAIDQYPDQEGIPLELELVDSIYDIGFDARRDPSTITVEVAGSYLFLIAPQVRRFPLAETQVCFDVWMRINGRDLANSAVEECWASETDWQTTSVLMLQAILPMDAGDTIQIMMRSLPEDKSGAVAIKHEGVPLVPSAIVSLIKVN